MCNSTYDEVKENSEEFDETVFDLNVNKSDEEYIYFWVRLFDYNFERDMYSKGTMLDEYYIKIHKKECVEKVRGLAKKEALNWFKEKYGDVKVGFARPRKDKDGFYFILMESDRFFYDRFYTEIDTYCLNDKCHKHIKGKACLFPKHDSNVYEDNTNHYCSYKCKRSVQERMTLEGEFQSRETGKGAVGYIYHIYNKVTNKHYIGQTKYYPFFRWQEHVKDGVKGDICDLVFDVICQVNREEGKTDDENKEYLNNIEAWWIQKYIEEGYDVMNCTVPKLTLSHLKEEFDNMLKRKGIKL